MDLVVQDERRVCERELCEEVGLEVERVPVLHRLTSYRRIFLDLGRSQNRTLRGVESRRHFRR